MYHLTHPHLCLRLCPRPLCRSPEFGLAVCEAADLSGPLAPVKSNYPLPPTLPLPCTSTDLLHSLGLRELRSHRPYAAKLRKSCCPPKIALDP